ncbi:MAG: hypothetical protein JSU94_20495 [Phycisphaerales bacterium]|nr:MAG: hypothetical protein JSU94_20495 [Phycisphaerales bacterium]
MMKSVSGFACRLALAALLCVCVCLPFGCGADQLGERRAEGTEVIVRMAPSESFMDQLGETRAEGSRRHRRVLRINRQEMMADIDRLLLLDRPSKLTDKRIP